MRRIFAIILGGLVLVLGYQQVQSSPVQPREQLAEAGYDRESASSQTCRRARVGKDGLPELAFNLKAEQTEVHGLEKAYFSMGCFWGSEAMLASCPGVLYTRTGFTGGTAPSPSYSAIADHVETVEVAFDPEVVSFEDLVNYFWTHHNARAKPIFRQYASAIFTTSQEQAESARRSRELRQEQGGPDPIHTAIIPLETFYPAEEYHQKYYLRQDEKLFALLPGSPRDHTRLATKLNALAGRAGERDELKQSLSELGLTPPQTEALMHRAYWPTE